MLVGTSFQKGYSLSPHSACLLFGIALVWGSKGQHDASGYNKDRMTSISLSLQLPENSSKYVLETPMNNLSYLQFFVSFLKRTGVLQGFRHATQKTP